LLRRLKSFLKTIEAANPNAVEFSFRGEPYPLHNETALALLRICQDVVINTLRCAEASTIQIQITYKSSAVELSVQDNGRGFDSTALGSGKEFGLASIRERAESIGAQVQISGEYGSRITVSVQSPAPDVHLGSQAA
jgi:signal transduction histidine kinase